MIPAGHTLGHPQRFTNGNGLTIFKASCACGECDVYGRLLPHLYAKHDEHLAVVRSRSMRNHPSRGDR